MQHSEVKIERDPESERLAYPWMTAEGYGVEDSGAVEGCNCEICELRRESER